MNAGDIEAGGHHQYSQSTGSSPLQAFSNFSNSISGLVRRQISPIVSGSHQDTTYSYSTVDSVDVSTSGLPVAEALGGDVTANSSDNDADSDPGRESSQFLLKMRICTLLDVFGLVYRSTLPMTWWVAYFRDSLDAVALVSQVLYVAIKLSDLALKARGAGIAAHLFFSNKIVRCFIFVYTNGITCLILIVLRNLVIIVLKKNYVREGITHASALCVLTTPDNP